MPFGEIFGQERATTFLSHNLTQGRIAHAYLFTGPEGVGKRRTALALAKSLNCQQEGGTPCENCNNCRRYARGVFPDIKEISPEGSSIKISQIRSLLGEIYFRPTEGRYKVYIITAADKMTPEAANSFLKVLEEPPEYIIFILLTEHLDLLLPTVISRCQQVAFYRLPVHLIRERLQRELGIPEREAAAAAVLASGSWESAQRLAASGGSPIRQRVLQFMVDICGKTGDRLWQWAEDLEKDAELPLFLEQILFLYRDLLVLKVSNAQELLLNRDQGEFLGKILPYYSRGRLLGALDALTETGRVLQGNVNRHLALDVLIAQLEPDLNS